MNSTSKKTVLLLGGGHVNIQVLHALSKVSQSQFNVVLISESDYSPYSGMLPGYMAGHYRFDQIHFNLKTICDRYGFKFVSEKIVKISGDQKQVQVESGAIFNFDICSINLGIIPFPIDATVINSKDVIYLKPISNLIKQWHCILEKWSSDKSINHLTIIGGGAAGFEIALACEQRFSNQNIKITLISGARKLLAGYQGNVRTKAKNILNFKKIELIEGLNVRQIESDHLILSDGQQLQKQICIIATAARAPEVLKNSDLSLSAEGFVRVNRFLQVEGTKNIFAAGDCCEFTPIPLPKAGVFAVREGPIVVENILRTLNSKSDLKSFKPQKTFLSIMVTGPRTALMSYRRLCINSRWAWRLKDFIDRRFMRRFS